MKLLCLSLAAVLGALMLTPSAYALSCAPPDIQRDLKRAIESDKIYHIFVGYFSAPDRPKNQLPGYLHNGGNNGGIFFDPSDRSEIINGSFSGYSLGKSRYQDSALEGLPVQMKITCAGHWCGQLPRKQTKMIAFVETQEGGPPVLTLSACPSMSHPYSEDKVSLLRQGL